MTKADTFDQSVQTFITALQYQSPEFVDCMIQFYSELDNGGLIEYYTSIFTKYSHHKKTLGFYIKYIECNQELSNETTNRIKASKIGNEIDAARTEIAKHNENGRSAMSKFNQEFENTRQNVHQVFQSLNLGEITRAESDLRLNEQLSQEQSRTNTLIFDNDSLPILIKKYKFGILGIIVLFLVVYVSIHSLTCYAFDSSCYYNDISIWISYLFFTLQMLLTSVILYLYLPRAEKDNEADGKTRKCHKYLWKHKKAFYYKIKLLLPLVTHFGDIASDIGAIIEYYQQSKKQNNDIDGLDYTWFFGISVFILCFSKLVSACMIYYQFSHNFNDFLLQLFDCYIFKIIYISCKNNYHEATSIQKMIYSMESILESAAQSLIGLYVFIYTMVFSDYSKMPSVIVIISTLFSMSQIANVSIRSDYYHFQTKKYKNAYTKLTVTNDSSEDENASDNGNNYKSDFLVIKCGKYVFHWQYAFRCIFRILDVVGHMCFYVWIWIWIGGYQISLLILLAFFGTVFITSLRKISKKKGINESLISDLRWMVMITLTPIGKKATTYFLLFLILEIILVAMYNPKCNGSSKDCFFEDNIDGWDSYTYYWNKTKYFIIFTIVSIIINIRIIYYFIKNKLFKLKIDEANPIIHCNIIGCTNISEIDVLLNCGYNIHYDVEQLVDPFLWENFQDPLTLIYFVQSDINLQSIIEYGFHYSQTFGFINFKHVWSRGILLNKILSQKDIHYWTQLFAFGKITYHCQSSIDYYSFVLICLKQSSFKFIQFLLTYVQVTKPESDEFSQENDPDGSKAVDHMKQIFQDHIEKSVLIKPIVRIYIKVYLETVVYPTILVTPPPAQPLSVNVVSIPDNNDNSNMHASASNSV